MSLIKQCQFIQLPQYPRCQLNYDTVLEVTRRGDRTRKEKYCAQHAGYRQMQYGKLGIKCKVISTRK